MPVVAFHSYFACCCNTLSGMLIIIGATGAGNEEDHRLRRRRLRLEHVCVVCRPVLHRAVAVALLGVSGAVPMARWQPFRPYILVVAGAMLAWAFWRTYRLRRVCLGEGVRGQTSRDNDVHFTLAFASALGSGDVRGAIAAWAEGAAESDIIAVREAMTCTTRPMPDPPLGQVTSDQRSLSLEVGSAAEVSEAVSQPAGSAPETAGTRAEITPSDAEQSFGSEFGQ
jgi:hypothetical protein